MKGPKTNMLNVYKFYLGTFCPYHSTLTDLSVSLMEVRGFGLTRTENLHLNRF